MHVRPLPASHLSVQELGGRGAQVIICVLLVQWVRGAREG